MILSSRGGAEAVIIQRGQAMINVIEEREYARLTLSQVIGHFTWGTEVLLDRKVRNEGAGNQGCSSLHEIISKEPVVPAEDVLGPLPYIINTEFFCEINGQKYVTVLRNFEGDRNQEMYRTTALQVAESLRVGK